MTENFTPEQTEERKKKKRAVLMIVLFGIACLIAVGTVIAYFSDLVGENGSVSTGDLRLNASHTVLLNGTATTFDDITGIAPGDVIVLRGSIANLGNESAWVRERLSVTSDSAELLDNLLIYNTELTQEQLLAGTAEPTLAMDDGVAVSGARVLNAAGGVTPTGGGFNYIDADNYTFAITVYFDHDAPNATQLQNFTFDISTQALQFRNNNTGIPSDAAWAAVEPAPAPAPAA